MTTQNPERSVFLTRAPGVRGVIVFAVLCVLVLWSALVSNGQSPATLASFDNASTGGHAGGSLIQATDGNFYGTTLQGGSGTGAAGNGTAFRLLADGTLGTMHAFTGGADGSSPTALTQATDGNFYGATAGGGAGGHGTLYRLSPEGVLTTLHTFANGADGGTPNAPTASSDGNLYGTTATGGAGGYGTVFCLSTDGTLTTLYAFTGGPDGASPLAALVQGSDGALYGTTAYGGNAVGYAGSGTVFGVTTGGALGTLYTFTGGSDGSYPFAPLVQGADGDFYGTTSGSAAGNNSGTAFRVNVGGAFLTLHEFANAADGDGPAGGLVQDGTGTLYGTTRTGGYSSGTTRADGTLFALSTDGALTTLYTFDGTGGAGYNPAAAMVLASDGTLYGTTVNGGAGDAGTVYTLAASPVTPPVTEPETPTVNLALAGSGALALGVDVGRVNFIRTGDVSARLRVRYALRGTAVNGEDYVGADGAPLTGVIYIPAGKAKAQLRVYATHTMDAYRTIKVILKGVPSGAYTVGETNVAPLVINTATPPE